MMSYLDAILLIVLVGLFLIGLAIADFDTRIKDIERRLGLDRRNKRAS